jgi:predicted lipoprotein with Yx(FWY)xxD motif
MNPSRSSRRRGRGAAGLGVLIIAAALVVAVTAFAAARAVMLRTARVHLTGPSGKRTERIAVNGRGVTVYWLGGETTRHLLCKTKQCFMFWPPVKVSHGAKVKAVGFKGRLGTLRRKGFTQATLNGHPVYTFVQDGGKRGVATGDGVVAFGGPWHVFKETAGHSSATSGGSSSTTSTSMTSTSPYPGY